MASETAGERWRMILHLEPGDTGGPSGHFNSQAEAERERERWLAMKAAYGLRLDRVTVERVT